MNVVFKVGVFYVSIGQGDGYYATSPGTVEVAIFDEDTNFVTREYHDTGDEVLGYQTAEDLLKIIDWCLRHSRSEGTKGRPIRVIRSGRGE